MKISNNIQTSYFLAAIRDIVEEYQSQNLVKTLATVESIDKEGFLVEVKFLDSKEGDKTIKGVPVLRNKYFNTPIYEKDLVMLLTLDKLFDSFILTGKYENVYTVSNYVALPYCIFEQFKHKNEFSIITKDEKFKLQLNEDDGLKIESQLPNEQKHKSLKVELQGDLEIAAQQNAAIAANQSVELKTAALSLGKAFEKLIDCFANTPAMNTPQGGPVSEWPAIVTQLQTIKTLISQNFK